MFSKLLPLRIKNYLLTTGQALREHWGWVLVAVPMLLNTIDFSAIRQMLVPLIFRDGAPLSGAKTLLLVHLIGVVWVSLQRRAITDPRHGHYIRSLPISPAAVARVQLIVIMLANNVIWLFFASQFSALWEQEFNRWDAANGVLFVLTVAACLLLAQALVLQRCWLAVAGVFGVNLVALYLHNVLAGPTELLAASALFMGLVAALLGAHKVQPTTVALSHRGAAAGCFWKGTAALLPPSAVIRLRVILLSSPSQAVIRLGLVATCVAGLTAVPLLGPDEPAAYVLLVEAYLCTVIYSGFFRPLKAEAERYSHYLSALPVTNSTLARQDVAFLAIMLLLSIMPTAILFAIQGRVSASEIALIVSAVLALLGMHKLALDYTSKQRVATLLLISVIWMLIACWVLLARSNG